MEKSTLPGRTARPGNFHTLNGKPVAAGAECRYYFNYPRSVKCRLLTVFEKMAWIEILKDFTTPDGIHVGRGRRVIVTRGKVKPVTAGKAEDNGAD